MKKYPLPFFMLLILNIFLAGCATQTTPMEVPPQITQTPIQIDQDEAEPTEVIPPTEMPPTETEITIDGDPSDWEGYDVLLTDPEGDTEGGDFDIIALRTFTNDKFLYVLVETHHPPADYTQVDLNVSAGGREFIISFQPQEFSTGFMGDVTGGEFKEIGQVIGSESAAAKAVEFKLPLSAFEDISGLSVSVRPMAGECCVLPDWYAIDEISPVQVIQTSETEPLSEIPAVPQVCAENIVSPIPFGALEPAPIELLEEGYTAEWFIAPGAFNMPQEIIITPDERILVYAVRSHTLSEVSLDGQIKLIAEDVWGYQGVTNSDGDIILHMHPNGWLTKVSAQGEKTLLAQSSELASSCDSGMGFGPDGDLYIAVSRCTNTNDLYRFSSSGQITKLAEVPDILALKTTPDGRFLAATSDTLGELSLDDYSFSPIVKIPGGNIASGGVAIDDNGLVYISTGSRSNDGKVFRLDLSDKDPAVELITNIPKNGLSGIEWLNTTGEIIGAQLRQGGILAISPDGEIREIISGNGMITPFGIGFSPCGELAVANDDGGMMTLIEPNGQVTWLMDYLSFIPPVSYIAFDAKGNLYTSEAAPGLYPVRVAVLSPGKYIETFIEAEYPSGLAWRSDGTLFISETTGGRIIQVSPDGTSKLFVEGLEFPQALVFDPNGNLFVVTGPSGFTPQPGTFITPTFGDRILQISPNGEVTEFAQLPGATGLTINSQGDLFVSISVSGSARAESKIIQFTTDGKRKEFASGFEDAIDLTFDLAGYLYVSDEHANGIIRIGGFPQGTLSGIVLDESGMHIENARVQVLSVDPIVVGQVVYTDENGEFQLPAAPRIYSVIIKAEGFQDSLIEDIEILDTQETTVEVNMEH